MAEAVPEILVMGGLALDHLKMPEGERSLPGGSGLFASIAASLFGRTGLMAHAGNACNWKEILRHTRVDCKGVSLDTERPGFEWWGEYLPNGERITRKVSTGGALESFLEIPDSWLKTPLWLCANHPPALQKAFIGNAAPSSVILYDTIDHWLREKPEEVRYCLSQSTVVSVNDEEWPLLKSLSPISENRHYLIKEGRKGGWYQRGKEPIARWNPFPCRNFQDSTGAGDAFLGAVAGILAQSKEGLTESWMNLACRTGAVAGSLACQTGGADGLLSPDFPTTFYHHWIAALRNSPPEEGKPVLPVVGAILKGPDQSIFGAKRPFHKEEGGRWEFPGGKIEPEESLDNALKREWLEELGYELPEGGDWLTPTLVDRGKDWLILFLKEIPVTEKPILQSNEHTEGNWFSKEGIAINDWAIADRRALYHWIMA